MKVHLIDGTYELFRAFYGTPNAKNGDGEDVGAVRGLVSSMIALLKAPDTSHVAVAFDTVIESFRNTLFDGYKTGEGIDPALRSQFELAESALRALGLTVWSMVEYEADDALATFAQRAQQVAEVSQVLLCTPDKDLAQCVCSERVVLFDRRRQQLLDESAVHEKFGVSPRQIPEYLALVGDPADGIPGVPKWGAKSAATLLRRYSSIDQIPSDPRAWDVTVRGAPGLSAKLEEFRSVLPLYRTLATLRTDVPLAESVTELAWQGALREPIERIARQLGDPKLPGRVPRYREGS